MQKRGNLNPVIELEAHGESLTPQVIPNRRVETIGATESHMFSHTKPERMVEESSGEKRISTIVFSQNEAKISMEGDKSLSNVIITRKDTINPMSGGDQKGVSLITRGYEPNPTGITLGEKFYMTPERTEEPLIQRIVNTRKGYQYQAAIPEMLLNNEDEEKDPKREECRLVWKPCRS